MKKIKQFLKDYSMKSIKDIQFPVRQIKYLNYKTLKSNFKKAKNKEDRMLLMSLLPN